MPCCAFPYTQGVTRIEAPGVKVADLPAGPINRHWTRNLIASPDGTKLYVSVGSNSNVAEKGIEQEVGRATIWEVDLRDGSRRVFASGLRNPVGLAWEPGTGALWAVVNERDELGSDLVPDYLTSVKDGAFYGWPYSYWGKIVDERVKPTQLDLVARAIKPTTRSARTSRRWAWPMPTAPRCPRPSRAGCSSASTGRGTASPGAVTTWSSSPSATAGPRARRWTC